MIAPTGLGKTAAVTLAWAFKRLKEDEATPRRLVWCLPMRTLVEQTAQEAESWMKRLADAWRSKGRKAPPAVHKLLGGDVDKDWVLDPTREAILIGTQDMLISRALMRGYGMSRFRWPIDFALLHTDSLWVFDEVQLMGAGLATSAQLEAFRRRDGRFFGLPARSLWVSATLDPAWLATVDFRKQVVEPLVYRWNDGAAAEPEKLTAILDAKKSVRKIESVASGNDEGKKLAAYAKTVASEILERHNKANPTLVIVNRIARAQAIFDALLKAGWESEVILLHSRFRQKERAAIVNKVREMQPSDGLIVISTQAVEAGVDISARLLITELAPWSSLVQRFGRCNRQGEFGTGANGASAEICWIDAVDDEKAARPYALVELQAAREELCKLAEASPRGLAPAASGPQARHVIRRKDFEELFDTDADLMGFDVDIAPYVRDAEDTDVRLFWRELPKKQKEPDDALVETSKKTNKPVREELCPASISAVNAWLKKDRNGNRAFRFDILATGEKSRRWLPVSGRNSRRIKPGDVLMIAADLGGYDERRGFYPQSTDTVPVVDVGAAQVKEPDEGQDDDPWSRKDKAVGLSDHLVHVRDAARALCEAVGLAEPCRSAVIRAAAWHDVGKAHEQFQLRAIWADGDPERPLAKATKWRRTWTADDDAPPPRPYFRHELASALAFLAQHDGEPNADLVAYLIAAHHGKVRMGIRSLPGEKAPDDKDALFVRGVWAGDVLEKVRAGEEISAATRLSLDVMRLGETPEGRPSWGARTLALLAEYGPFKLAFLETLVRLADWKASEDEQKGEASS